MKIFIVSTAHGDFDNGEMGITSVMPFPDKEAAVKHFNESKKTVRDSVRSFLRDSDRDTSTSQSTHKNGESRIWRLTSEVTTSEVRLDAVEMAGIGRTFTSEELEKTARDLFSSHNVREIFVQAYNYDEKFGSPFFFNFCSEPDDAYGPHRICIDENGHLDAVCFSRENGGPFHITPALDCPDELESLTDFVEAYFDAVDAKDIPLFLSWDEEHKFEDNEGLLILDKRIWRSEFKDNTRKQICESVIRNYDEISSLDEPRISLSLAEYNLPAQRLGINSDDVFIDKLAGNLKDIKNGFGLSVYLAKHYNNPKDGYYTFDDVGLEEIDDYDFLMQIMDIAKKHQGSHLRY